MLNTYLAEALTKIKGEFGEVKQVIYAALPKTFSGINNKAGVTG